jgi:hypothetical protein
VGVAVRESGDLAHDRHECKESSRDGKLHLWRSENDGKKDLFQWFVKEEVGAL